MQDALSSITFVGETAFNTTRRVARGVLYLTLGERMSNTGFVTFRKMSACAASRQVINYLSRLYGCDAFESLLLVPSPVYALPENRCVVLTVCVEGAWTRIQIRFSGR